MPGRKSLIDRLYSSRGGISYVIELWHDELAKHRKIKGSDPHFVERMAEVQLAEWDELWAKKVAAAARSEQAQRDKESREASKQLAVEQTQEAERLLEQLANTLRHTLDRNDAIDWQQLKDHSLFPTPAPLKPPPPPRPTPPPLPLEPLPTDERYQPQLGWIDKLIPARQEMKTSVATRMFQRDHATWQQHKEQALEAAAAQQKAHWELVSKLDQAFEQNMASWEAERTEFLNRQQEQNVSIESQKEQYLQSAPDAIRSYCDLVLSNSEYPAFFPKEWELDYNAETRVLAVDYSLPPPDAVPTLAEVKYVTARNEFSERHLSPPQVAKLYDDLLYQLALRIVHELFEADQMSALETVAFNGYVRSIDKATGVEANGCVLSLQVRREEFAKINLAHVDPKACFKQLKGVGSSKLHSLVPVAPIIRLRRDDGRFVSSYEVGHQLDEGYNLAAMDWEDFEHLIRELFAKEFSSSGGEVKVTQASRDGGVDAVAFDPDPIRGGKIVIQAKRYTNTVGVAAVRDLYGTVMNEGATKGILVTTSDYGPDAYEFANGKPLTLLNGGNLLHLLEKHGHKARINLQEARSLALGQPVSRQS
jgi:restriction system protein